MAMIYLNTYRTGLEPKTAYLFSAFRKERIWHVLGGMAWMYLWIFLWSLIPVAGIVFGVIRAYEYRFTPYILMTRDDVKPTEAIKVSKAETMGYKRAKCSARTCWRPARGSWGSRCCRCSVRSRISACCSRSCASCSIWPTACWLRCFSAF